jgi:hypothetical protein
MEIKQDHPSSKALEPRTAVIVGVVATSAAIAVATIAWAILFGSPVVIGATGGAASLALAVGATGYALDSRVTKVKTLVPQDHEETIVKVNDPPIPSTIRVLEFPTPSTETARLSDGSSNTLDPLPLGSATSAARVDQPVVVSLSPAIALPQSVAFPTAENASSSSPRVVATSPSENLEADSAGPRAEGSALDGVRVEEVDSSPAASSARAEVLPAISDLPSLQLPLLLTAPGLPLQVLSPEPSSVVVAAMPFPPLIPPSTIAPLTAPTASTPTTLSTAHVAASRLDLQPSVSLSPPILAPAPSLLTPQNLVASPAPSTALPSVVVTLDPPLPVAQSAAPSASSVTLPASTQASMSAVALEPPPSSLLPSAPSLATLPLFQEE